MKRPMWVLPAVAVLSVLPGCEGGLFGRSRANIAGPTSMLAETQEAFTDQRLAQIVASAALAPNPNAVVCGGPSAGAPSAGAPAASSVCTDPDRAIQNFWPTIRQSAHDMTEAQNRARSARNEIQGQLFTASIQRCNWFKTYLRRLSADSDLVFGLAGLVAGGVGSILTGAEGARIASGVSGMFAGTRAEFDRDIMSGLTSSVIIPGIETARIQIMSEITKRRCLGLDSYTLSAAIADSIRFHGACSFDVGVKVASQAIEHANDNSVGMDALQSTLTQMKKVQDAARQLSQPPPAAGGNAQAAPGQPAPGTKPVTGEAPVTAGNNSPDWLTGMSLPVVECPMLDQNGQMTTPDLQVVSLKMITSEPAPAVVPQKPKAAEKPKAAGSP